MPFMWRIIIVLESNIFPECNLNKAQLKVLQHLLSTVAVLQHKRWVRQTVEDANEIQDQLIWPLIILSVLNDIELWES